MKREIFGTHLISHNARIGSDEKPTTFLELESAMPRGVRRNIDHASHAISAVCSAKVIICSGLAKLELIDCPRI